MLQNLTQISIVTGLQTTEPLASVTARCQLDFNSETPSLAASLVWAGPHSVQLGSAAGRDTERQNPNYREGRGGGAERGQT